MIVETIGDLTAKEGVLDPKMKGLLANRTVAILGRANCHREVFTVRTEYLSKGRMRSVAKARSTAREKLAELEATT